MRNKIIIALSLLVIAYASVAQDVTTEVTTSVTTTTETPALKSRKGFPILPEADEWGLGVSADPFLRYLGNFMHGNAAQLDPDFNFADNVADNIALFGKLIVDENTAYRVRFNVSVRTDANKAIVGQDRVDANPAYPAFTEDWRKVSSTNIVIAPGYEKRRGKTRLQGIYGGELVLGFSNTKTEYQYGNPITLDFQAPTRTDFGDGNDLGGSWTTESKAGSSFLIGARGFVGVEYFFAPKISIGGEFGYMISYRTQGKGKVTSERWGATVNSVETIDTDVYNNSGFSSTGIGLDNLNGSINLLFYF